MDVDGDIVTRLGGEEGEKVANRVVDGGWGSRRVAFLESRRTGLAGRRIRSIVDMLLRDRLDDGCRGVEAASTDRKEEGRGQSAGTGEGGSQLRDGAKKRPAHD